MNAFPRYLMLALDFIFLKQPTRTGLGFIFGLATRSILKIVAVWITGIQTILFVMSNWDFGLLGIVIFHIPTVKDLLWGRHNLLTENEEKALTLIDTSNLTDFQKQEMRLKLVEKVLERADLMPHQQNDFSKKSS